MTAIRIREPTEIFQRRFSIGWPTIWRQIRNPLFLCLVMNRLCRSLTLTTGDIGTKEIVWMLTRKNNHRFWKLLRRYRVTVTLLFAVIPTIFSFSKINGLWQLDAGHSRGIGDTGAPSTFLKILVGEKTCWVDVYRDDGNGGPYGLTHIIVLD